MILQALVEHYDRLAEQGKVSREGWCMAKVSYGINLSKEGKVTGIISLKTEEERGKKKVWAPQVMTVPEMVTRSSGVSANFLCDNSKYLLGIDVEGTNQRLTDCFEAAKEKHLTLLKDVNSEMAQAVCRFFESWDPRRAEESSEIQDHWDDITDGGNLIFCRGIDYAQDDSAIQEAWERARNSSGESEQMGICLVTGKQAEISSAPVGRYAEFAYTTALNYLLGQREYTFQLGDSMILFWAEDAKEEYQAAFFSCADPKRDNQKEIKGIFDNLKQQRQVQFDDVVLNLEQKFYILSLAPNAARLSVRFFYQDSFGNILGNLAKHYERMSIVKPSWAGEEYLGIRSMLSETVNQNSKDKTPVPNMAALVLQAILSGARYPASLYTDVLIRIRAEQGNITWGRAGIIKAYLIRNMGWKEGENYMGLNEESQDRAYVLGRLFSVLESIQLDTNPGIKATIRDRYFNAACATPASVFPILVKLKNSHMKKLEREKGSAKIYYEKLLTEIMGKIEGEFPARLSLEEQGKFILGYYHQVQKKYEKREEN